MRTLLVISTSLLLLACGFWTQEHERTVGTTRGAPPPSTLGVVTLEREIILSDAIMRGTLSNVEAGVTRDAEGRYRPSVKFNFTVLETLKGTYTDGTVSGIWVGAYSYNTRDETIARSRQRIIERDTQWDNREAILFLDRRQYADLHESALNTSSHYILAKALERAGPADDHHSLYSAYHRTWLPSANTAGQGDDKVFLLTPPAPTDAIDHPNGRTITLGAMKQLIANITTEYDGGDGSDAYRECLDWKYEYLQLVRNKPIVLGVTYTHWNADQTIDSGQSANTTIDAKTMTFVDGSSYQVGDAIPVTRPISFHGIHADLFTMGTTPARSGAGLEYDELLQTVRPLPAGSYEFTMDTRPVAFAICNHFYRDEYTVTVNAPDGTLHELFFDPVAVGSAVSADATNGVLKPASFTDANGASTTLGSISYEAGEVKVEVTPDDALGGHILDFIELDGTVSLSLDVADATVDAANGTLSWSVSSQPWEDGDMLMVRIRGAR